MNPETDTLLVVAKRTMAEPEKHRARPLPLKPPEKPFPDYFDPELLVLSELEPAPDGVELPGLELPPLPASPPEPGRAVPLVLAPLVPLGLFDSPELDELPDDVEPLMLLPLEVLPALSVLVAAIRGSERKQLNPAAVNTHFNVLFIVISLFVTRNRGGHNGWRLFQRLPVCDSRKSKKGVEKGRLGDERLNGCRLSQGPNVSA